MASNNNQTALSDHIEEKDEQLRRLKEALTISEENNAETRRLYMELLKQRQQQRLSSVGSPQHEIGVLRAQLEAKTQTIRRYDGDIMRLQAQLDSLEEELRTERSKNYSNRTNNSRTVNKKPARPSVSFNDTPTISLLPPSPKVSIVSWNSQPNDGYTAKKMCACILM